MATDGPPVCECGYLAVGRCVDCSTWVCAEHGRRVEDRLRCDRDAEGLEALRAEEAERKEAAARLREERRILDAAGWDEAGADRWEDGREGALAWAAVDFGPAEAEAWLGEGISPDDAAAFRSVGIDLEAADDWTRNGFTPVDAATWSARGWDADAAERWVSLNCPTPDAAAQAESAGCQLCRRSADVWGLERVDGKLACSRCAGICDCCYSQGILEHLGDVRHPLRAEVRTDVSVCSDCSPLLAEGTGSAWDALFGDDLDLDLDLDGDLDDDDLDFDSISDDDLVLDEDW